MQRQPKVRVTSIRRSEPDIRLFVLALIELARELESGSDSSVEVACPEDDEENEH